MAIASGQRPPPVPPAPKGPLCKARTCPHAITALHDGDRAVMARLYTDLLPAAGELAGAGSGLLTLRPVEHYLADLASALGDAAAAEEHRHQARELAKRAGAPHWL